MYCLNKKPKEYVMKIKKDNHIIRTPIDVTILEKKSTFPLFFKSILFQNKDNNIEDKKLITTQNETIIIESDVL